MLGVKGLRKINKWGQREGSWHKALASKLDELYLYQVLHPLMGQNAYQSNLRGFIVSLRGHSSSGCERCSKGTKPPWSGGREVNATAHLAFSVVLSLDPQFMG